MATVVTRSNLLVESRQNVFDLINNTSNVADPIISSAEFREWVYSREPDVNNNGFAGYPFIIVHPSVTSFDDVGMSLDRRIKFINFTVEVEVVASDRGNNNRDGQGLSHLDSISDEILGVFNSVTHRNTLKTNHLYFSNPDVTGVVVEELNDTLIYRRSFLLSFRTRIAVSA